jgi:hypothetical protein
MLVMTGHSIFAHSQSSTSEGFCLIIIKIIKYLLSEYLQNKSAQILCPVVIIRKICDSKGPKMCSLILSVSEVNSVSA